MFRQTLNIVVCTIAIVLCSTVVMAAATPRLSYQGFLTDAGGDPVADGPHLVQFRIWDAASGGTELWNSSYRSVETTNGLFSYNLGDTVALDPAIIQSNPNLWVGVKVGTDPELAPRTRLTSVPYAISAEHAASTDWSTISGIPSGFADGDDDDGDHDIAYADARYVNVSGDNMTGTLQAPTVYVGTGSSTSGSLKLYSASDAVEYITATAGPYGGRFKILGQSGFQFVTMDVDESPGYGGYFLVARNMGYAGFSVDGNYNGTESPKVTIEGVSQSAVFNMSTTGDATVVLPTDAINSTEMLNEPGIAASRSNSQVILTQGATVMADIETLSITIPAAGYIVVKADLTTYVTGTTTRNYGLTQIDQTTGGPILGGHFHAWGTWGATATSIYYQNVSHTRIYYKTAGTHIFRVEGKADNNGAGATTVIFATWLTATYYPTSYGTVETIVASPGDFDNPESVSLQDLDGNTTTAYKVDLRDLELRATKARLEAQRLELELAQAKMGQQNQTNAEGK